MEFCPKCDNILISENSKIVCSSCGYKAKKEVKMLLKEKVKHENTGHGVIEEKKETMPTTKEECSKCGNSTAFFWSVQTRASDEPETQFFRCTKCKHTWREYA